MEIKSSLEKVTPAIAAEWLMHNGSNRRLDERRVKVYENIIREGLWKVNGDAIRFDMEGNLIDGQHRLQAIVKSGQSVQTFVIRGLEKESFATIDNGKSRTAADVFYINGVKNSTIIPGILKTYEELKLGHRDTKSNITITNIEAQKIYFEDTEFYGMVATETNTLRKGNSFLPASTIGGNACYLIKDRNYPEDMVFSFFRQLCGKQMIKENGIYLLRERLMKERLHGVKTTRYVQQILLIKVWNAFVKGKQLKKLVYDETKDKDIWFI